MKPRKPRSDSTKAAVQAMVDAAKPLPSPPKHVRMRKEHIPFWDDIVRARSLAEWTEVDLVVAAQLARCQYDIEQESEELRLESTILTNARGTQVMNPRVTVLEQLARREMALMRTLRMGGRVVGAARDMGNQRSLEREARKVREEVADEEDDELLAR